MDELYVDQVMSRPVETVTGKTTIQEAATEMIEHDLGALVVVDDSDHLVGLLTATDFIHLARDARAEFSAPVTEFMQSDVLTTTRDTLLSEVVETMLDQLIHHVPVVDDEAVVGMVTTLDVTAALSQR